MSGPLWQLDGDATSLIRQDLKTLVFIGLCLVFLTPIHILAKVSSWAHRTTPFQGRHADLRVLVNTLAHGFKSHKSLKVIVYLNDLYMQDLKAILGLFEAPSCCVSFEERWLLWDGCPAERPHVLGKSEANYKRFIEQAAEEVGNKIILSVPPSLEELEIDTTDDGDVRGNKIIVKRRRLWLEEVL
ncbi:hypothetical protein N7454_004362 [Penicillium verhagenii]|nr:hypothetical protein N7454_004362 [Penicillium verhagenii]